VGHQVLLALSAGALWGAGVRIASLACPVGLARVVSAAAIAVTLAVIEALALGLFGLGTDAAALAGAAAATWLTATRLRPLDGPRPLDEAMAWWRGLPPAPKAAFGAIAGLFLVWTAWLLRTPALGVDSLVYHLPEALDWIENGRPGSIETVFPLLPVGNYPLANEVLVAWGMAVGRSFAAVSLLAPAMVALLAASAWLGLRECDVPPRIAALAAAVVCSTPILSMWQLYGAQTDLPALAWLTTGGALVACSRRQARLAGPALAALGLAIGTKTTVVPLAALLAALLVYVHRSRLRVLARPLGLGLAAAVGVGGVWYLRNLVRHGSPVWPFVAAPWGDPVPHGFLSKPLNVHFLERPGETLSRLGSTYVHLIAGGLPLLIGGLGAWVLSRRREVIAVSAVIAGLIALWTNGPLTGVTHDRALDPLVASSIRYLLPGMAAAVFAIALVARRPGLARGTAVCVLGVALAWNLLRDHSFGFPSFPPVALLLGGAAVGALASRVPLGSRVPRFVAPAGLVVLGVLLAAAASGYVSRHGRTGLVDAGLVSWISHQPAFRDRDDPIAVAPTSVSPLAGDRLQHRLDLVPIAEGCARVESRARTAWVVLRRDRDTRDYAARDCFAGRAPAYEDPAFRVFGPPQDGAP
jgi:hypothetical protein